MTKIDDMINEREELLNEMNINLEKINELDQKILECQKESRVYFMQFFWNNHNLEIYRRKEYVLEKGIGLSLFKVLCLAREKIRIFLLEKESDAAENSRMYYQNKIAGYKDEKNQLEKDNISIKNKIFIIDYELKKDFVCVNNKTLIKEMTNYKKSSTF